MRYIFWALVLVLGTKEVCFAQQDAQFSQFMFNKQYYNPAAVGLQKGFADITLVHRSQWLGYTPTLDDGGSPSTQVMTLSAPVKALHGGLGLNIVNDKLGAMGSLEASFSYAFHYELGEEKTLSIGLRGGVYNQYIDFSVFRPRDQNDPVLEGKTGIESQFKADFALGGFYKTSRFFGGIGLNHIASPKFDYATSINIVSLKPHLNVMGGYNFYMDKLTFTPALLLKTDFQSFSTDANVLATYDDSFFVGAGGRFSKEFDDIIAVIGVNLLSNKALRISYSFDYVMSGQTAKSPTSHEVTIGYRLPLAAPIFKPIIRTPRFRH